MQLPWSYLRRVHRYLTSQNASVMEELVAAQLLGAELQQQLEALTQQLQALQGRVCLLPLPRLVRPQCRRWFFGGGLTLLPRHMCGELAVHRMPCGMHHTRVHPQLDRPVGVSEKQLTSSHSGRAASHIKLPVEAIMSRCTSAYVIQST
jgi:hypothetical protein